MSGPTPIGTVTVWRAVRWGVEAAAAFAAAPYRNILFGLGTVAPVLIVKVAGAWPAPVDIVAIGIVMLLVFSVRIGALIAIRASVGKIRMMDLLLNTVVGEAGGKRVPALLALFTRPSFTNFYAIAFVVLAAQRLEERSAGVSVAESQVHSALAYLWLIFFAEILLSTESPRAPSILFGSVAPNLTSIRLARGPGARAFSVGVFVVMLSAVLAVGPSVATPLWIAVLSMASALSSCYTYVVAREFET